MNDETRLRRFRANWISSFILHPSAFILSIAMLAAFAFFTATLGMLPADAGHVECSLLNVEWRMMTVSTRWMARIVSGFTPTPFTSVDL